MKSDGAVSRNPQRFKFGPMLFEPGHYCNRANPLSLVIRAVVAVNEYHRRINPLRRMI
jgi:hypothetical protein